MKRREFIRAGAGGLAIAAGGTIVSRLAQAAELPEPWTLPAGTAESAVLEALPGKLPLIKRSFRPPNFETPIEYFKESVHAEPRVFRALPLGYNPGGECPDVAVEDRRGVGG